MIFEPFWFLLNRIIYIYIYIQLYIYMYSNTSLLKMFWCFILFCWSTCTSFGPFAQSLCQCSQGPTLVVCDRSFRCMDPVLMDFFVFSCGCFTHVFCCWMFTSSRKGETERFFGWIWKKETGVTRSPWAMVHFLVGDLPVKPMVSFL